MPQPPQAGLPKIESSSADLRVEAAWATSLSLAFLLLYLFTRSEFHVPDVLAYGRLVKDSALTLPQFFEAERVLSSFVPWLAVEILRGLGYAGDTIQAMQVLNALAGGFGIGATFLLARTVGGSRISRSTAAGAAAFVGVAFGYWHHATQAENQILPIALMLVAFVALFRVLKGAGSARESIVFSASVLAVATVLHATIIVALPAAAAAIWLGTRDIRRLLTFLAIFGGVVVAVYLGVGILIVGLASPEQFWHWLTELPSASSGVWGRLGLRTISAGLATLAGSIMFADGGPDWPLVTRDPINAANVARIVAFGAVLGSVAAVVLHALVRFRRGPIRPVAIVLFVWAGAHLAFAAFWAADDVQFWIASTPPLVMIGLLVYQHITTEWAGRRWLTTAAVGGLVVVAAVNLGAVFLPQTNAAANHDLIAARCAAERIRAFDLMISPGWGWAGSYLPYMSTSPNFSLFDNFLITASGDRGALFATLDREIRSTLDRGGIVYIAELYVLDDSATEYFTRVLGGLEPNDFVLDREIAFECDGEPVWRLNVEAQTARH